MSIAPEEILARYILYHRYIRENQTIKPDVFIPYPYSELSVTRHNNLTETKLWRIGSYIAKKQNRNLYGRVDLRAADYFTEKLTVVSAPSLHNCNHANVKGWPVEKAQQKIIAAVLAEKAGKAILYKEGLKSN